MTGLYYRVAPKQLPRSVRVPTTTTGSLSAIPPSIPLNGIPGFVHMLVIIVFEITTILAIINIITLDTLNPIYHLNSAHVCLLRATLSLHEPPPLNVTSHGCGSMLGKGVDHP